jgi:hypothetical protein
MDTEEKHISAVEKLAVARNTVSAIYANKLRLIRQWEIRCAGDKMKLCCAEYPVVEAALETWFRHGRALRMPITLDNTSFG